MAAWLRFLAQYPLAVWRTTRDLGGVAVPTERRGLWRIAWAMRYCWGLRP